MIKQYKSKNHIYFIIIALITLCALFFLVSCWKIYIYNSIQTTPDSYIQIEDSDQDVIIGSIAKNSLITSAQDVYRTLLESNDPILGQTSGNLDDKVLVIEFGDFTDDDTKGLSQDVHQLLSDYAEDIIFVWKDFPLAFNLESRNASLAARCAQEQDGFWEYYNLLLQQNTLDYQIYLSLANQLNLNISKFSSCYEKQQGLEIIGNNMQQAEDYGVDSVPYLFIGGRKFNPINMGYQYEDLARILQEEISKVKQQGQ